MYEVFEKLMKERGETFTDVAKAVGGRASSFTDWRAGRSKPKADKLKKIADHFGVTVEYLMTGETQTGYYLSPEAAKIAQDMFEDEDMRTLYHMKQTMDPERFAVHMRSMKDLYRLEHPDDDTGC